jgi:hypothetical protein
MSFTLTDTLPEDAGNRKFLGLVDSSTGDFVLLRAVNVETIGSLDFGDLGIALQPATGTTTQTHDAASIDTTENVGTEVNSGGYSRAAVFVDVGSGADVRVRAYVRLASSGDSYEIAMLSDGQQASTRQCYILEFAAPYLAIGLEAVSGSATCSCSVYLIP